MPVSTFHALAAGFCAAAAVDTPRLWPDAEGIVSFTARLDGVDVAISHDAAGHPDHAFVLVMFGAVPSDREPAVHRELLNANLLMLGAGAPAFSVNPLDGQVILHYVYPLAEASGDALLAGLESVTAIALRWRQTLCLADMAVPTRLHAPSLLA